MSDAPRAPAATLVIFGAMGDLAKRLLVPAIVNLAEAGLIDDATTILGVSHHDADDEALRGALDEFVEDKDGWKALRERIAYLKGDFEDVRIAFTKLSRVRIRLGRKSSYAMSTMRLPVRNAICPRSR